MDSSDPLSGFDMESFVLEITEDQYSGETSILPWNNPIEQVVTTSEHGDDVLGRLELMPQRVDARYLICLTIGIGGLVPRARLWQSRCLLIQMLSGFKLFGLL